MIALLVPATASARDAIVKSFDGTPIVTHFFPAQGATSGAKAPTILVGHGFGGTGASDPDSTGSAPGVSTLLGGNSVPIGEFIRAGYNVLTWDARGFGGSGGKVEVDSPEFEGRDVQALLDFVAGQAESQLDEAGDPRVGMHGGSYGGAIQLITAGLDKRIDVITPVIAWNELVSSLYKAQTVKAGWGLVLSAGLVPSATGGLGSPAGTQTGTFNPVLADGLTTATATGRFPQEAIDFFEGRNLNSLVDRIRIPTLILQGTVDTLFTLREAMDNHAVLKANGVPLKMMWFCGGHGICLGDSGPAGHTSDAVLAWFSLHLKGDRSTNTGPPFEWLTDDDGRWHSAEMFPLDTPSTLKATGGGTLPITPGTNGGVLLYSTASIGPAINIDVPTPGQRVDVVGEPQLKLSYSGTSAVPDARVFAQIIERKSGRVVGNQVTPIRVSLDGKQRTIEVPLEPIAAQSGPGQGLQLQLLSSSNVYDIQRNAGVVNVESAELTLPVIDPDARGALAVGKPSRLSTARRGRSVRIALRASRDAYRSVTGRLYRVTRRGGKRRLTRIGISRGVDVPAGDRRVLSLPVRRRLPRGTYVAKVVGNDAYGRRVSLESPGARLRRR